MATRTNLWKYRQNLTDTTDLVGFDVDATDGHIGKIDEASNDVDRAHIVVDTGFWIFGKKRMIPAGVVQGVDRDDRRVFVSMTKDQIKSAPDYEGDETDDAYYETSSRYYDSYGW